MKGKLTSTISRLQPNHFYRFSSSPFACIPESYNVSPSTIPPTPTPPPHQGKFAISLPSWCKNFPSSFAHFVPGGLRGTTWCVIDPVRPGLKGAGHMGGGDDARKRGEREGRMREDGGGGGWGGGGALGSEDGPEERGGCLPIKSPPHTPPAGKYFVHQSAFMKQLATSCPIFSFNQKQTNKQTLF